MNEHPILFSGEMVRAILEGRKTQTRRAVKFKTPSGRRTNDPTFQAMEHLTMKSVYPMPKGGFVFWDSEPSEKVKEFSDKVYANSKDDWYCPYGQPGDRLWVRETWKINSFAEGPIEFQYKVDGAILEENDEFAGTSRYDSWYERVCWRAEQYLKKTNYAIDEDSGMYEWANGQSPLPWQSSIFMPRWASRITLEIVSIRVQRVQDITYADIIDEGITGHFLAYPDAVKTALKDLAGSQARTAYQNLWDSLNAKRGYPWASNPWVWAIEFKVVTK